MMTRKSNETNNEQGVSMLLPGKNGDAGFLQELIDKADVDVEILLGAGEFRIKQPIRISKSIRFIGAGRDQTILTGKNLPSLLTAANAEIIQIEGITFRNERGKKPASVVLIDAGKLVMKDCSFTGGVSGKGLGNGLEVRGTTIVDIIGCHFEENDESGLKLTGNTTGTVRSCSASKHDAGISVEENANVDLFRNDVYGNHVGIAYTGVAAGNVEENTFLENRGAFLARENAKPSLLNNKFKTGKAAIMLAENCSVRILENDITDFETGIMVRNNSKTVIEKNEIYENEEGIHLLEDSHGTIIGNHIFRQKFYGIVPDNNSVSEIRDNMIDENHKTGIKADGQARINIRDNQLRGNFQIGVHARGKSKGNVENNIIFNSGLATTYQDEGNQTKITNNTEGPARDSSIAYQKLEEKLVVSCPDIDCLVTFNEIVSQINPGNTIEFSNGYYFLNEAIEIDKPIKLIAAEPGKVIFVGCSLDNLVKYSGSGKLIIDGITLSLNSFGSSNVMIIESGEAEIKNCKIGLGRDREKTKKDSGAGISLRGNSKSNIINSQFEANDYGLLLMNEARVDIRGCKFNDNFYGAIFREQSSANIIDNEFLSNRSYGLMAYDDSSLTVTGNSCHNNKAGYGFINNTKAIIENNKAFENEYHGFFIDNNAKCTIKNNQSYENQLSGVAVFGDSQTVIEDNEIFNNSRAGIDYGENPTSTVRNNNIYENSNGIYLEAAARVTVESNDIYENEIGIVINGEAVGIITNNKIHDNSEDGIEDGSDSDSTIVDNLLENNGGGDDDEEENDDEGFNPGNLLAMMLGSENLSNNPNIAAIPLSNTMLESGKIDLAKDLKKHS